MPAGIFNLMFINVITYNSLKPVRGLDMEVPDKLHNGVTRYIIKTTPKFTIAGRAKINTEWWGVPSWRKVITKTSTKWQAFLLELQKTSGILNVRVEGFCCRSNPGSRDAVARAGKFGTYQKV